MEKRPRKKRVPKEPVDITYEGGFKPGNIVIVSSPTVLVGTFIGAVLEPEKWCDAGIPVAINHDTYKRLCIRTQFGDTIGHAPRKANSPV